MLVAWVARHDLRATLAYLLNMQLCELVHLHSNIRVARADWQSVRVMAERHRAPFVCESLIDAVIH